MMDKEQKELIIKKLAEVLPELTCPMCHHSQFIIADGFIMDSMYSDYDKQSMADRKSIPSVAIICKNCGFVSQHAIGVLGLLDK